MEIADPYQDWQFYAQMCQDDPFEDIIDDYQESESRRILAEIERRKKERMANKEIVWLQEGF